MSPRSRSLNFFLLQSDCQPSHSPATDKCHSGTRKRCCFPVHCLSGADVLICRIIPFPITVAHSVSMAEPKADTPGTLLEKLVLHSPRPSSPSLKASGRARDLTAMFQAVAKEETIHHYSNKVTVSIIHEYNVFTHPALASMIIYLPLFILIYQTIYLTFSSSASGLPYPPSVGLSI